MVSLEYSESEGMPTTTQTSPLMSTKAAVDPEKAETLPDPAKYIDAELVPRLDPAFIDYFLRVVVKSPFAGRDVSIAEVRERPESFRSPLAADTSGEPRVEDHEVSSEDGTKITARVYHPDPKDFGDGPYPVHLNFHGEDLLPSSDNC